MLIQHSQAIICRSRTMKTANCGKMVLGRKIIMNSELGRLKVNFNCPLLFHLHVLVIFRKLLATYSSKLAFIEMSQKSILSFIGGTKHPAETEICQTPTKKRNREKSDECSPKVIRKFNEEWTESYPWLITSESGGVIVMKCQWCINAGKTNVFATKGTSNFQNSALTRHEAHADHISVVNGRLAKEKKQTIVHITEEQVEKNEQPGSESKAAQFRTMYHLAKNGLPLSAYNDLLDLQRQNGCTSLQDKSTIYTGAGTHSEMLDFLDEEVEASVLADVDFSDFVGIIVDETTDITIHKKLNVYFKCFKAGTCEPVIHFMDCVAIPNGTADTIVSEIVKLCTHLGLDMLKVISMASDGASVMTGRKNGVGVKLREQQNHRLVQIHCVAHRLALCAAQACKDVPSFSEYSATVKSVYRFYHNSAVRYNQLREMEAVLDSDGDTRHVTLKEPASSRWLSLESAVKAILKVYPALVSTLENQAASGVPEAKGLLQKVRQVSFLLRTAFLVDVFEVVNTLCRVFQKNELDIHVVNVSVQSTLDTLDILKVSNGDELNRAYSDIVDCKYKGVKVNDTQQYRMNFQTSANSYLDKLKENIEDRFEDKSMDKLQTANKILNPAYLPSTTAEIAQHGKQDLDTICDWLGPYGNVSGLVDCERMRKDFLQFKMVLKRLRGKSLQQVCQEIIKSYSEMFPDFTVLAKYILTAPLTSVACERGFSNQNRLKTKARSRLTHGNLTKLIRIMEGPSVKDFDADRVVSKFAKSKNRRK